MGDKDYVVLDKMFYHTIEEVEHAINYYCVEKLERQGMLRDKPITDEDIDAWNRTGEWIGPYLGVTMRIRSEKHYHGGLSNHVYSHRRWTAETDIHTYPKGHTLGAVKITLHGNSDNMTIEQIVNRPRDYVRVRIVGCWLMFDSFWQGLAKFLLSYLEATKEPGYQVQENIIAMGQAGDNAPRRKDMLQLFRKFLFEADGKETFEFVEMIGKSVSYVVSERDEQQQMTLAPHFRISSDTGAYKLLFVGGYLSGRKFNFTCPIAVIEFIQEKLGECEARLLINTDLRCWKPAEETGRMSHKVLEGWEGVWRSFVEWLWLFILDEWKRKVSTEAVNSNAPGAGGNGAGQAVLLERKDPDREKRKDKLIALHEQGKTQSECATDLNVSVGTIKNLTSEIREERDIVLKWK